MKIFAPLFLLYFFAGCENDKSFDEIVLVFEHAETKSAEFRNELQNDEFTQAFAGVLSESEYFHFVKTGEISSNFEPIPTDQKVFRKPFQISQDSRIAASIIKSPGFFVVTDAIRFSTKPPESIGLSPAYYRAKLFVDFSALIKDSPERKYIFENLDFVSIKITSIRNDLIFYSSMCFRESASEKFGRYSGLIISIPEGDYLAQVVAPNSSRVLDEFFKTTKEIRIAPKTSESYNLTFDSIGQD